MIRKPMTRFVTIGAAIVFLAVISGLAGCKKSVGELRTVDVVADAQSDPSQPANVDIKLSAGTLHLSPGGAHIVGGAVKSNVSSLDPKIEAGGDHVTITQGAAGTNASQWGNDLVADWRLTLGPSPIALSVETGAGGAELELGGLALKSLRVHSGAGPIQAGWGQPNALTADTLDIETGAGTIVLTDVARFGASKLRVHAGVGSIDMSLGNKVDRDVSIDVEASAGAVTIKIPANVTARAIVQRGVGGVTSEGWKNEGGVYVLGTPGSTPRVSVNARTGAGSVTLIALP
jgi:hypothetical protein